MGMKSRMAITIGCARRSVACGSQHRIGAGYHADRPLVGGAEQHDAAEAGVAPDAHHPRVGDDVKRHRPEKVRGLVDRAHWPIAVPRRRTGDDHGAVRKRHQRLAGDGLPIAADFLRKRHPHHRARLPIRQGACRSNGLDALHQQRQILHPRRKNLGHQVSGGLQTKGLGRYELMHLAHCPIPLESHPSPRPDRPRPSRPANAVEPLCRCRLSSSAGADWRRDSQGPTNAHISDESDTTHT